MRRLNLLASACLFTAGVIAPFVGSGVSAAPVIVTLNADFSAAPVSFTFDGATFTFSATGDFFEPTAVQTAGGGAVRSFGGFLGIPIEPSTDFPGRGSGILDYGPSDSYSAFPTTTTIPYSNGDNYLGLRASLNGLDYFGYAFTTDNTLNSFGFETTPGTDFVIDTNPAPAAVPEPASWAMFIGGFGLIGGALRRRKPMVTFA